MKDFLIPKAYAYTAPNITGGTSAEVLLRKIVDNIVTPIIYLIAALAVVYFLWGVFVFIQNADNPEKRKEGFNHMIWGIVGLFIMVSAKGIISIILRTMGL